MTQTPNVIAVALLKRAPFVGILVIGFLCLACISTQRLYIPLSEFFTPNRLAQNVGSLGFFDKERFCNAPIRDYSFNRTIEFRRFLFSYGWRRLDRKDVKNLLGRADHRYIDSDIYYLANGFCGNTFVGVEIRYDNDVMAKYRYLNLETAGDWIPAGGIAISR